MKKTPKILPTYYKSKGTPIFRDTTALPFAVGGNINPTNPTNPAKPSPKPSPKPSGPQVVYISNYPEYQYRQQRYLDSLSTVEGGVYRSLDLVNKPRAYTNIPDGRKTPYYPNNEYKFYSPRNQHSVIGGVVEAGNPYRSLNISPTHVVSAPSRGAQSEAFYLKFKAPVQKPVYKPPTPPKPSVKPNPKPVVPVIPEEPIPVVPPKPELMEEMRTLQPDPITRKPLGSLVVPEFPAFPTYQMPGYKKDFPAIYMRAHHSGQLIPHPIPTLTTRYKPTIESRITQKLTGYDRNFMEGYYNEEGNYVPGELENAQEQNRAPQFVGASSFKDMLAQREYLKTLQQTRGYAQGGGLAFILS